MRVHELAKQLDLTSKECVQRLIELGVDVKNHMSAVGEDAVKLMTGGKAAAAKTPPPAPESPAPKKSAPAHKAPAAHKSPAAKKAAPTAEQAKTLPEKPVILPEPALATLAKPASATISSATTSDAKAAPEVIPDVKSFRPSARGKKVQESKPAPVSTGSLESSSDKVIHVKGPVIVGDLAKALNLRPNVVISALMKRNVLASINQKIDLNAAREIAELYGYTLASDKRTAQQQHQAPTKQKRMEEEDEVDKAEDMVKRSPVVTFLGHVDHGKTSLLDYIRKARVAASEHGGITQHIGAYTVEHAGQTITFLDTPGHAAFTAMRARGANLTDIAVIIIAADDGIMPQTREAIKHAQAADVEMMVAINKIDLPSASADKTMQQLQAEGLTPEDWGGNLICCPVSATTGQGVDHLLEMITLQSEVLELKADPKRRAKGFIIEAQMEHGRGPTANALVTAGTLNIGDFVLCGAFCGKVKALTDDRGKSIKTAGPSTPVKILGLSGIPSAGAEFRVYANEKAARVIAEERSQQLKTEQLGSQPKASLDSLFSQMDASAKVELNIVLKADTQGSLEAIEYSLSQIKSEKISLNFILSSIGNISVNDVMLASASDAVVLGFHVGREPGVEAICKREGVETHLHQIIYELLDQVTEAMTGMLAPEYQEKISGMAEVLQIFPLSKTVSVAGCRVIKGTIHAKDRARVRRGEEILFEGRIDSLRHFQDQVAEVKETQECGVRLDGFHAMEQGDRIEFYVIEELEKVL